jgi:FlgD Ig-like domain
VKKVSNRLYQVGLWTTALSIILLTTSTTKGAGAVTFELAAPASQGYLSNTVIDFIQHGGGVWGATGKGLNFTIDGGQSWQYYNVSNATGLVSDNVSAMYSTGGRFWVATNHNEEISGGLVSVSDGVAYTDNSGQSWTRINFGSFPNNIPYVWGGDRTIFDITGYSNGLDKDYLFFSSFAGGFLGSADGGATWKRVFPSRGDSAQFYGGTAPSLRNLYFSCVTDSTHGDTVMVYAGTAGGLLQYSFADKRDKPFSKVYNAIAFRDQNSDSTDNYVFLGGNLSLTRGLKKGGPYISRFEEDGLTDGNVTAILDFRGRIIIGTRATTVDSTSHLLLSDDRGDSFFSPTTDSVSGTGPNTKISDFAVISERIYMAAQTAGLFVSADSGDNWTQLYVDSANQSLFNGWNTVNALDPLGDTLRIGTDSGLVTIYMDASGVFQSLRKLSFPENGSSSTKVVQVKTQEFYSVVDSVNVYDSLAVWTINRPLTTGTNIIARSIGDADTSFGAGYQVGISINDLGFIGDTAFVVGPNGIGLSLFGGNPVLPYYVRQYSSTNVNVVIDSLTLDTITVIEAQGDSIYLGTKNGFAFSLNHGTNWKIVRTNQSPIAPDFVALYAVGVNGISGDWFPALGVQTLSDQPYPLIWATSRPTFSGYDGISVGWMRPLTDSITGDTLLYRLSWNSVYKGFAWNYAFSGKTVYAATDGGLIYTNADSVLYADTVRWDTIDLKDANNEPLLLPGTPVYAVAVVDTFLWVGTGDRTIRIKLSDLSQTAYYVADAVTPIDEVYAFPIPYSNVRNQALDFHFRLEAQANVTLEIYDFAMNLVRRVIDNEQYPPGIYPTTGSLRRTWDGMNGKGEPVAVGMYYFKVSLSSGDTRWGKIAVIP